MSSTKRHMYNAFIMKLKQEKSRKIYQYTQKHFRIQCMSTFWICVFLEEQKILKKLIFSENKITQIY